MRHWRKNRGKITIFVRYVTVTHLARQSISRTVATDMMKVQCSNCSESAIRRLNAIPAGAERIEILVMVFFTEHTIWWDRAIATKLDHQSLRARVYDSRTVSWASRVQSELRIIFYNSRLENCTDECADWWGVSIDMRANWYCIAERLSNCTLQPLWSSDHGNGLNSIEMCWFA